MKIFLLIFSLASISFATKVPVCKSIHHSGFFNDTLLSTLATFSFDISVTANNDPFNQNNLTVTNFTEWFSNNGTFARISPWYFLYYENLYKKVDCSLMKEDCLFQFPNAQIQYGFRFAYRHQIPPQWEMIQGPDIFVADGSFFNGFYGNLWDPNGEKCMQVETAFGGTNLFLWASSCCTRFDYVEIPDINNDKCQQFESKAIITDPSKAASIQLKADYLVLPSGSLQIDFSLLSASDPSYKYDFYSTWPVVSYLSGDQNTLNQSMTLAITNNSQYEMIFNYKYSTLKTSWDNIMDLQGIIVGEIINRNGVFLRNLNSPFTVANPCWTKKSIVPFTKAAYESSFCCVKFESSESTSTKTSTIYSSTSPTASTATQVTSSVPSTPPATAPSTPSTTGQSTAVPIAPSSTAVSSTSPPTPSTSGPSTPSSTAIPLSTAPPSTTITPPPALPTTTQSSNIPPTPSPSNSLGSLCSNNTKKAWLDIVYVIDTSNAMSTRTLKAVSGQIATLMDEFTLAQIGDHTTRAAIITYATNVSTLVSLKNTTDSGSFTDVLFELESLANPNDGGGSVQKALHHAYTLLQNETSSRIPLIVLYAAAYNLQGLQGADLTSNVIKADGISIVVVNFDSAQGILTETLKKVSSPGYYYISDEIGIYPSLSYAFSQINCKCPDGWAQLRVSNTVWQNYTNFADCYYSDGTSIAPTYAERVCHPGTLAAVTSETKLNFIIESVIPKSVIDQAKFSIGLHKSAGAWNWWGYNGTEYPHGSFPGKGNPIQPEDNYGYMWNFNSTDWDLFTGNDIPLPYVCQSRACDAEFICDLTQIV